MELKNILEKIELEILNESDLRCDVETIYIGDLLSFVMANGKQQALWLTVQRHINVIAVATLNDFAGIVFVENVDPDQETLQKANELHIPLLKTSLDAYHLARKFYEIGL